MSFSKTTVEFNNLVYSLTDNTSAEDQYYPKDVQLLLMVHTYKRPHGSDTLNEFVTAFIEPLKNHQNVRAYEVAMEGEQPLAILITTDARSETMMSCHLDTVHHLSGRQRVEYDAELGLLYKPSADRQEVGDCLGADDGAGVWLLLQMIEAGVPGTYAFHYGEEKGGVGSCGMANLYPTLLKKFKRAIAFDRKGSTDIITHQGGRCCSDGFAQALADQLNGTGQGLSMAPDNGGIFTDTANYTHLIPECTNVACGYEGAHAAGEFLDVEYLLRLRDALVQVDWEALPTLRDTRDTGWADGWGYASAQQGNAWLYETDTATLTDMTLNMGYIELVDWVRDEDPRTVAEVLMELADRLAAAEDNTTPWPKGY